MKGKKAQQKRKLMAAACSMLLSTCFCTEICRASVVKVTGGDVFYDHIHYLYEDNVGWYDDEDDDWNGSPGDNWYDNPDAGHNQSDKGDEPAHKPFTAEIPAGYTPIRSIVELQGINDNPSGKYILMNDIDMTQETSPGGSWDTGNGWTPLKSFSGTFDGNGYRIIGMHIYGNALDASDDIGLFSKLENGGTVRNLGMADCDIDVTARNPYGDYASFSVGGIAGSAGSGQSIISNCYVSGTVKAGSSRNHDRISIGGIIGLSSGMVRDCYNMADISAPDAECVGGVAGTGSVTGCYNIGKIDAASYAEYAGPVVGFNVAAGTSTGNYYLAGTFSAGGSGGSNYRALTDAQMRHAGSFTGFHFNGQSSESTWMIDELSAYPYPQLCSCPQVRVEKLEMTKYPDKLTYSQGDALDLSGAVLSVTYEDGVTTSTGIKPDMVSGIDMDKASVQTAVITYLNADCTFDITVDEIEASGISLSKKNCSLARNKKIQLNAVVIPSNASDKSVQWTSDNEVVATVTNQGIVRGVNAGTARITAATGNGLSASCVVTVTVPAKSIVLNKTVLTLKTGKQKKLKAELNPLESTDKIEWSSSDPRIASVNGSGLVKAKKKGYATVMAKTSSEKRAYVKITVK